MKTSFSPKNNPRVIIIQKLYGKFFNNDEELLDFFHIQDFLKVFVQTIDSATLQDWLKTIETDRTNKKS